MENREKEDIVLKLAICLNRNITANKLIAKANKAQGRKDPKLVTSLRQLEAASGINFSSIQLISAGVKNASFSTIVAIADGFGISPSEFLSCYPDITVDELNAVRKKKNQSKNSKS
jgi:transcriptional regulator with XRE-family HTH domain